MISYHIHIFSYHLLVSIFTFIFGFLFIDSLYDTNITYTIMTGIISISCFLGSIKTGLDLHKTRREYD